MGKFRQWLEDSVPVLNDPTNPNNMQANQTAQIAQQWLANGKSAQQQASLVQAAKANDKNGLAKQLFNAGADAVKSAPQIAAKQTAAPLVADFLQKALGLPKTFDPKQVGQNAV